MRAFLLLAAVVLATLLGVVTCINEECPSNSTTVRCARDPCTGRVCQLVPGAQCVRDFCGTCNYAFVYNGENVTKRCDPPPCPSDVPVVRCVQDPCTNRRCPGVLGATCVANYCGGCNYVFRSLDGRNVSDQCSINTTCPNGVSQVQCFADPCQRRTCPAFPNAQCRSNFCGGCNFGFFLNGTNVTERCSTREEECPVVTETTAGICSQLCDPDNDDSCSEGQECCSTGCGTSCQRPVNVTVCVDRQDRRFQVGETFRATDGCNTCVCLDDGSIACTKIACNITSNRGCPMQSDSGGFGTCDVRCTNDSVCSDGQLCCGNCPRACVDPVPVCRVNGVQYQVNDTFTAADGCNNCTCTSSGLVRCGRRSCIDPCYDEPDTDPGDCLLALPLRYFYNARMGVCRNYTRGCDADSTNDFATAGDCYERCKPSSVCNGPIYPPGYVPRCAVIVKRYTFSGYQGMCLNISFRPCGQDTEDYNVFGSYRECYDTCIGPSNTTTPSNCSSGLVRCFVNPCSTTFCPNFPNASCVANYCGRCSAQFFSGTRNVTNFCEPTIPMCPDGSPIVRCATDPCSSAACPSQPGARCVPNYCGRCGYKYWDSDGQDITHQCNATLPLPIRQPVCPNINSTLFSICASTCTSDSSCSTGQLCCSTSCGGRTCTAGTYIPYYPVPTICPPPTLLDSISRNCSAVRTCSNNSDCAYGQACCSSSCGRVCRASANEYPCSSVVRQINGAGITPPPGYYTPICDDSGRFNATQCTTDGNCWCVDINSGRPVTSYYPRGVRPQCQTCTYNRRQYAVGASFASTDGCNKCSCTSRGVVCTLRACLDTCSLPPEAGLCRGYFPSYYYNRTSQRCEKFVYGGCGGNNNRFRSVRDCLSQCNNRSVCLLRGDTGPCDALGYPFFFNSSSDRCETFQYGGCRGNGNRFSTGLQCAAACNPDEPVPSCATAGCGLPACEGNAVRVRGDTRCCPYCRPTGCTDDQFTCSDGTCISSDSRCDRIKDCRDASDEMDCVEECEFRCTNGQCIERSQVCDSILDCRDGSDSLNCRTFTGGVRLTPDLATRCPSDEESFCSRPVDCEGNDDCTNGSICCSNQCGGRSCVRGVPLNCQGIRRKQEQSGLFGAFVPACQDDGSFNLTQCRGLFCWCVDTVTGQPASDAVALPMIPDCMQCMGRNNVRLSIGERQISEDGCNTCVCNSDGLVCTRLRCENANCMFGDKVVRSGTTYSDDCNVCNCSGGSLTCKRKVCGGVTDARVMKRRVKTTIPFSGAFNKITEVNDFIRQTLRTFLDLYQERFGLDQDQLEDIKVKSGSVIVIITFTSSNSTTDGANITALVGQVEEDFNSGVLIIRYDGQVLEPTGEITVETLEQTTPEPDTSGLLTWHIVIIVIAAILLLVIGIGVAVAIIVVVRKTSRNNDKVAVFNDYNDHEMKMPLQ